jgi:AcrR family transcriptional regulator
MSPSSAKKVRLTRAEQSAERSRALLESAWAVFCEKGYESVTIDDVAAHAGYSRMPIYSLFGDKQTLFFELWSKMLDTISERLLSQLKTGGPLRANINKLATAVAASRPGDQPKAGESLFFVVQTIALSRPEIEKRLIELSRKVLADFAGMINSSTLAKGEKLRSSADNIAAHLVAHINGLSTVRFQTGLDYVQARDLEPIFIAITFATKPE